MFYILTIHGKIGDDEQLCPLSVQFSDQTGHVKRYHGKGVAEPPVIVALRYNLTKTC